MTLRLQGTAEFQELAFNEEKELLISADVIAPPVDASANKSCIDFVAVIDVSGRYGASWRGEVRALLITFVTRCHVRGEQQ